MFYRIRKEHIYPLVGVKLSMNFEKYCKYLQADLGSRRPGR